MRNRLPTCGAKTRDGYSCGRPCIRVHNGLWRCVRHSRASDPAIPADRIVAWQASDALREAKGSLFSIEQRLKNLEAADKAARATFIAPTLTETTDWGTGKRVSKRTATVVFNGHDWTDRKVTATVYLPIGWYGNGIPTVEITPSVEHVLAGGGAAPQALAMLWAWIAEATDSARGDQCRDLFGAIEKATRELEEAQRLVIVGETHYAKVKEALS